MEDSRRKKKNCVNRLSNTDHTNTKTVERSQLRFFEYYIRMDEGTAVKQIWTEKLAKWPTIKKLGGRNE